MMLKAPALAPFCFGVIFSPFGSVMEADDAPQSLTNAQKLSLPPNTAVGTVVHVTDGFVVNGAGSGVNYFFRQVGTFGGKPYYETTQLNSDSNAVANCTWNTTVWELTNSQTGEGYTAEGDVPFPWLATGWDNAPDGGTLPLPTLTHPAVQELAAPSSAQGGVFIPELGIFTIRGLVGSRDAYGLLGIDDESVLISNGGEIFWTGSEWDINDSGGGRTYYSLSAVATPDLVVATPPVFVIDFNNLNVSTNLQVGEISGGGLIINSDGVGNLADSDINWTGVGDFISLGLDDTPSKQQVIDKLVAIGSGRIIDPGELTIRVSPIDSALIRLNPLQFPGMTGSSVTTPYGGWFNADGDGVASITATSVSQGELDTGVAVAGAGTSAANGIFTPIEPLGGRQQFIALDQSFGIDWEPDWFIGSAYTSSTNAAFPFSLTFTTAAGTPPAPTVTRNDVASEANWEVV